jgi:uncharacterized RDD family membrane protein YckC
MKQVNVVTSHNISIDYEAAPLMSRAIALLLDLVIQAFYILLAFGFFGAIKFNSDEFDLEALFFFLVIFAPVTFYSLILGYLLKGQTIGKLALGIRVVKLNGHNASLGDYILRWTFRIIDFWFSLGAIGALFISTTDKGQRLGDILAETAVVRIKPEQQYSIKDILNIKNRSHHEPTYLAVTKFTDEDMILIKNAISRVKKYPNEAHKQFIRDLAIRAANDLNLEEVPHKKVTFLKTLLQDYIVLTR